RNDDRPGEGRWGRYVARRIRRRQREGVAAGSEARVALWARARGSGPRVELAVEAGACLAGGEGEARRRLRRGIGGRGRDGDDRRSQIDGPSIGDRTG